MKKTFPLRCRPAGKLLALATAVALVACGGGSSAPTTLTAPAEGSSLNQVAALGELIFKDQSLSASGKQSCASCHDPSNAHAQTNDLSVQLGGPNGDIPGFRAVPSLRYLSFAPAFFFAKDGTPTGGFNRDGRAQSLAEQGHRPFLAPHEMANKDAAEVIGRLKQASYAEQFRKIFGADIFDRPDDAFERATFALQQYQKEDPSFHPFDSKYDAFLAGKVQLTAAEQRGLALFNNPAKGNCAACHLSQPTRDGLPPLFTDTEYEALGVPRDAALAINRDPRFHDMGLCGPVRTDLVRQTQYCGMFLTPTLRNVARRKVFFHNGVYHDLRQVLRFYNFRDVDPGRIYPRDAAGHVLKYDDLPRRYWANIDVADAPFDRRLGEKPPLTDDEMADIIAFLGTLNDGYKPASH